MCVCSINIYSSGGVEDGEEGGGNVFDVIDPVLLLPISFERRPLNMAVHVFEPDTLMALFFFPFLPLLVLPAWPAPHFI